MTNKEIIQALLQGHHLNDNELSAAETLVHFLQVELRSRKKSKLDDK